MKLKVELFTSQYGSLLVYINKMRVIGPGHQGILKPIASAIVDTDELPGEDFWKDEEEE